MEASMRMRRDLKWNSLFGLKRKMIHDENKGGERWEEAGLPKRTKKRA